MNRIAASRLRLSTAQWKLLRDIKESGELKMPRFGSSPARTLKAMGLIKWGPKLVPMCERVLTLTKNGEIAAKVSVKYQANP